MDDVEEFVIDYLRSRPLSPPTPGAFDGASRLLEMGLMDSLELMALVTHLEQSYGFSLPNEEFAPENFETPRAIANMIKRVNSRPK